MFNQWIFPWHRLSYFNRFCSTRWVEDKHVAERDKEIWEPFKKVVKYWESLSKSQRPANRSYECLQCHYTDLLVPAKLQFFAFVAGIFEPYLVMFQTDLPMVPFMFPKLEKIFDKLHWLIFRQESLAAPITNKLRRNGQITLHTI